MAFNICGTRKASPNGLKRQRSKLQKATGPRTIGTPTCLKVNPLPNPGEAGFQGDVEQFLKMNATSRGFNGRPNLPPMEPTLRPISVSFVNASYSGGASLQDVCGVTDAVRSSARPSSQAGSIHSAIDERQENSLIPPMPTRAAPQPPKAPSATEFPQSLAGATPESTSNKLESAPISTVRNTAPTVARRGAALADDPGLANIPPLDEHALELYKEYQRTGEIHYCIPESAVDDNNKQTWQHCSSLINAYLYGFSVRDVDFADRVMDILDERIAKGVCADVETIFHIFAAYTVPEQLRQFVVNRCLDADASNFQREHTRRLPKLYVLMALKTAKDRMASSVSSSPSSPKICEYHLHSGGSERCYRRIAGRRGQRREAKIEQPMQGKNKKMKESAPQRRRRASSKALIRTAEAVKIIKVNGKSTDTVSINTVDSLKTVEAIEINRSNSRAKQKRPIPVLTKETWRTSNRYSGLENEPLRNTPLDSQAESDNKAPLNERTTEVAMTSSSDIKTLDQWKENTQPEDETATSTCELVDQHSSSTSMYTTPDSTPSTPELSAKQCETVPLMDHECFVSQESSMYQISMLPGAYPDSLPLHERYYSCR
jgi:hypothetical protein